MGKEHLTYFKVENFKRFDSLELTDIGQFNLIVGDNNVGKTSVLEALLFSEDRKECFRNLHKTLLDKVILIHPTFVYTSDGRIEKVNLPVENFWKYIFNDLSKTLHFEIFQVDQVFPTKIDIAFVEISSIPEEKIKAYSIDASYRGLGFYFECRKPGMQIVENIEIGRDFYQHFTPNIFDIELPLLTVETQVEKNFAKIYFNTVGLSRQATRDLIKRLEIFIPNIEALEGRRIGEMDYIMVGLAGTDEYYPLNTFGEGVIRATRILLEIMKHKGKRLMIDEIDTGIHYSRMKNFLKTIFQVAEKNDVQLFMTTHSLECQQAFAEVFEEPDMVGHQSKARSYTLVEKPDGQVAAQVFNFDAMKFSLDTGFEIRGGAL